MLPNAVFGNSTCQRIVPNSAYNSARLIKIGRTWHKPNSDMFGWTHMNFRKTINIRVQSVAGSTIQMYKTLLVLVTKHCICSYIALYDEHGFTLQVVTISGFVSFLL